MSVVPILVHGYPLIDRPGADLRGFVDRLVDLVALPWGGAAVVALSLVRDVAALVTAWLVVLTACLVLTA
jgi:hypothetical protein